MSMVVIKMAENKYFKIEKLSGSLEKDEILKYLKVIKGTMDSCRDIVVGDSWLDLSINNRLDVYKEVIWENFQTVINFIEISHEKVVDL